MKLFASIVAIALLASCSSMRVVQAGSPAWNAAVTAEGFVAKSGYTVAGLPSGEAVKNAEIFDVLKSADQIKADRAGTLEPQASGVDDLGGGSFYVLFRLRKDSRMGRVVLVENGVPVQVLHDPIEIVESRWMPLRRGAP